MTNYTDYGLLELNEVIRKLWPWVSLEDADRIAWGVRALPLPPPTTKRRIVEWNYLRARYAYHEAKKLRTHREPVSPS